MSRYTTELRYLIDQGWDPGLKEYPIFDEKYRNVLNGKILDHYRYEEIGFETPARFKHYLNSKMTEIMPYYNMLYSLELEKLDPLGLLYEETYHNTTDGSSLSTSKGGSSQDREVEIDNLGVHSNTPGGMLKIGDIKNNTYASEATIANDKSKEKNTGSSSATNTGSVSNTEDYIKTVTGVLGGSKSRAISEYMSLIKNIDLLIIEELNTLFMGVY